MNKFNLLFAITLLVSFLARAQGDQLTLSAAIEKALENNYGVIISRADREISEINNNWGNAGRYPTIGFDASDNNSYGLHNDTYTNRLSAGIGLNWNIFNGFSVSITKSKLENLEEASSGRLMILIENTVEDIILTYYNVLLQKEQLEVLKKVMELSNDRYQYELKRQSLGGSVTYNVLQAQNVYLTDKANFMSQEVVVRNAIRNLNFIMGEDAVRRWDFEEPFEPKTTSYNLQDLLSKMRSSNQTLKNQYTNLLLKQDETSLTESSYYPSLSVGAGMEFSQSWSRVSGAPVVGSQSASPYGNIRLSYDIYTAGVRKRAMEVARINEKVAQVEIDQMEHALTNELLNLFDYYEVRIELFNVALENLEAAELNLLISEEKYRSGVINSFNYRDVQLIYLNAALRRLQAIYNLIDSNTQLTRITGGFLGTEQQ